jgi:hypothetical protein
MFCYAGNITVFLANNNKKIKRGHCPVINAVNKLSLDGKLLLSPLIKMSDPSPGEKGGGLCILYDIN